MEFLEELKSKIKQCKGCSLRKICLKHNLQPAFPAGYLKHPLMFVFIAPTPKNLTTHKNWKGERLFFFGDKKFWKFLNMVGLFNSEILKKIENSNWEKELIEPIKKELENQKIYITNLVKCPTPNANYPPKEAIRACIQFLEKEIEFLQPIKIFAFGAFTFEVLTRKKIKLNQFFSTFNQDSVNERILPCYFPTGRGNFQLAIEGLKRLLKYLKWTKLQQPN